MGLAIRVAGQIHNNMKQHKLLNTYEGRPINKLQTGITLLIFKI